MSVQTDTSGGSGDHEQLPDNTNLIKNNRRCCREFSPWNIFTMIYIALSTIYLIVSYYDESRTIITDMFGPVLSSIFLCVSLAIHVLWALYILSWIPLLMTKAVYYSLPILLWLSIRVITWVMFIYAIIYLIGYHVFSVSDPRRYVYDALSAIDYLPHLIYRRVIQYDDIRTMLMQIYS
jgi:hypothetical protein